MLVNLKYTFHTGATNNDQVVLLSGINYVRLTPTSKRKKIKYLQIFTVKMGAISNILSRY